MGFESKIYVGPYVVCKPQMVQKIIKIHGCSKCNIKSNSSIVKYCHECGCPIDFYDKQISATSVNYQEVMEKIHEGLFALSATDDVHIWAPNFKLNCEEFPPIKFEGWKDCVHEISQPLITCQLNTFKKQFEVELTILDLEYENTHEPAWGVVQYVS